MNPPLPINDGRQVELTRQAIHSVQSVWGGWNRRQVELMGMKWPLKRGWIERVIGTRISLDDWYALVAARNKHAKDFKTSNIPEKKA